MLVRYQNAIELIDGLADAVQTEGDFLPAQARVDKDARTFGRDESGVTRTAACENADLDDSSPSLPY